MGRLCFPLLLHMLPPEVEAQIVDLSNRYGKPQRVTVELAGWPFDPLTRTDRYGEVCMVIRRPSGKLLTAIKTHYPANGFRLLTGGVSHGEAIETALFREVDEETSLTIRIARFLAVIEYRLHSHPGLDMQFATFAFLLEEQDGILQVRDQTEQHAAFREIMPGELPALAEQLEQQSDAYDPAIGGSWGDWGRFRAVVHRVVHTELSR